ncbi:hypothetical protein EJ08DRAFT_445825 [Tothia fuscella]|uniref:Uncharacterized protein n=1 Tax=Tothia fuscella TaxID=1048955 RepID=A0A9P4NJS1_9PEZI|nr:hypothetical protein EJ08DRAFT_445825 [Tothia fuscella]
MRQLNDQYVHKLMGDVKTPHQVCFWPKLRTSFLVLLRGHPHNLHKTTLQNFNLTTVLSLALAFRYFQAERERVCEITRTLDAIRACSFVVMKKRKHCRALTEHVKVGKHTPDTKPGLWNNEARYLDITRYLKLSSEVDARNASHRAENATSQALGSAMFSTES